MSTTMIIRELSRHPAEAGYDQLTFERGVNVLVGEPNTGKTRWLEMLDYAFGDDNKAEDKLGEDVFEKYESVSATVEIADESFVISRRWRQTGVKGKVFVNDEPKDRDEFQSFLLGKLGIPEVSYPQGNPYGPRSWPTLRFRSLLRHMYRRQRLWDDFADRQPESEQHACIMQFTGIAERLFSDSYANMIAKQKQIHELETRRENFVRILSEISNELMGESLAGLSVTPDGLSKGISTLQQETSRLISERDSLVQETVHASQEPDGSLPTEQGVQELSQEIVDLRGKREDVTTRVHANARRRAELAGFRDLAKSELARLSRAKSSTEVLSPIKITHCPACDRKIETQRQNAECYLCGKTLTDSESESESRLGFEIEQLESEVRETEDLLANLADDDAALSRERDEIDSRIMELQRQIQPTRHAVMAVLPPQVLVLDGEIGRVQERISQLERISRSLSKREQLAEEVQRIRKEVTELEADVGRLSAETDFETASDRISDGMNDYVKALMVETQPAWTQGPLSFSLKERSFNARVGRAKWRAQLGGTLSLYFLFAYHYALMSLVQFGECNYPGLAILDFPAEVEGASVKDKENFILEPFISLQRKQGFEQTQLIAAGSAFEGLEGTHRIELTRVWKT